MLIAQALILLLLLRNPQNQTEYDYEKLNLTIMVNKARSSVSNSSLSQTFALGSLDSLEPLFYLSEDHFH